MEKLIITVALTGNVPTKQMNPNVPVTPDEIAAPDEARSIFSLNPAYKDRILNLSSQF